jgi:ferrous iron transport protein B
MAAKEVVVSTMGILYQAGTDTDETSGSLKQKMAEQTFTSGERAGQKVFSPLVAFTLMLFVLIYVPCIATIVAIGRESSWKWALFSIGYTVALAWILSFMTYQVGLIL